MAGGCHTGAATVLGGLPFVVGHVESLSKHHPLRVEAPRRAGKLHLGDMWESGRKRFFLEEDANGSNAVEKTGRSVMIAALG